ncbi:hypothetical protein [Nocardia aurantiaca]|uniref:Uncharacterized protein n=1 Tax=Nocardia aurantiaca TaxID=2675850 RepID=A0A6I3L731_9NOCA|nr:hypothetical protein [Nocardia aurantiaca]MTE16770.1 hypothetical protein [Nocardia aurantiaca]
MTMWVEGEKALELLCHNEVATPNTFRADCLNPQEADRLDPRRERLTSRLAGRPGFGLFAAHARRREQTRSHDGPFGGVEEVGGEGDSGFVFVALSGIRCPDGRFPIRHRQG